VALAAALALAGGALAAGPATYELEGALDPPARGVVSIWGYSTAFTSSAVTDLRGRFRFKKLRQGSYTVSAAAKGVGEARRTVEVGPGSADAKRKVSIVLKLEAPQVDPKEAMRRQYAVPASELAIPPKARSEFEEAMKELSRHREQEAVRRLERAVELAPRFALAWNDLGTVAYRSRQWARAEECFRKSLAADPGAFEPLVNLGGVLVTVSRPDEAYEYNLQAVLQRPGDALANSQMGMNYFQLGNLDLAEKYLQAARRIDPGHFSHPQILLVEIMMRSGRNREAADALEEFLRHHPDDPRAESMRQAITKLRK
jgi:tetratricopeptide (TPR) repeat protein